MKPFPWTPEKEAIVADCAKNGMSIRATAKLLECSRSSVERIAKKLGIEFHATSRPAWGRKKSLGSRLIEAAKEAHAMVQRMKAEPKSIVDLETGECRWPITERSPHMFCAAPCDIARAYCDEHHAMGNQPLTARQKPYDVYKHHQPYGSILDKS